MRQEVVIANPAIITDDGLERSIIQEGLGGGGFKTLQDRVSGGKEKTKKALQTIGE